MKRESIDTQARCASEWIFALFRRIHLLAIRVCILLLFATPSLTLAEAVPTLTPEEELQTFTVPDGFQVNLYASEELGVLNPMQMRFDAEGRLYVISTLGYPQLRPGEKPIDKIIRLSDTDADGRADKSEVFADGLNIPTGIEVGDGGVYVGEQTELVFLKDKDGDGKAEREVVLSGFGVGDTHQAINSFVWSPGGELYLNQGDGIESRVETPWGVSGLFQAGFMRFRPRRLQLDPILDDFMGPGNPWGIAFDDWGQTFVVDGAGGVTFLSPAMMPVRHVRRLRRIGKPGGYCGIDILGSEHLPDDFQGDHIVGDFQRSRIGRYETKANGSGYEVVWKEPLLVSSHRNFRPVDVRIGHDGAIYVCDWYNSVICHQDDPFRHPDRDFTHGRIWRISHKEKPPIKRPELRDATVYELFEHLKSPERWIRYQAKRVLATREPKLVASALASKFRSMPMDEQDDRLLLEVVSAIESVEIVNKNLLWNLADAEDHRARAYAARVAGRWQDRLKNPLTLLRKLAKDSHPLVRMEAAVACAHVPDAKSAEIASLVADEPIDYDIDYAFSQALQHLKSHWIPAFRRGELTFDGDANRTVEVLKRVDSSELNESLREMAVSNEISPPTKLAVLRTLARSGDESDLQRLLGAAASDSKNAGVLLSELAGIYRDSGKKPNSTSNALRKLLSSEEVEVAKQATELVGLWKVDELHKTVATTANDSSKPLDVRLSAIAAMTRFDEDAALELAVGHLREPSLSDVHYNRLILVFASRRGGFEKLEKSLQDSDLDVGAARRLLISLNSIGTAPDSFVRWLTEKAELSVTLPEYNAELVAKLATEIPGGDAQRGEHLFSTKANCYACHQVGGVGGVVGPDLSAVGTTLPSDRLIQEVFWPQRLVKEGYTLRQIVTDEGQVIQGYVRKSRDKKRVLLRPTNSETLIRIHKDSIEDQQDIGSAMPTNVIATLLPAERIDLLRFLSELGKPGEYGVTEREFVRQWSVKSAGSWRSQFARVNGKVSLDKSVGPAVMKATFDTKNERRRLVIDELAGVEAWVDGKQLTLDENVELDFEPGEHELKIAVDPEKRANQEISVEWEHVD